jgi:MFS transporter, NNP family, nitrate/nitrite transporter
MAGSALPNEMPQQAPRMLAMSTSAFMVSFAAWTIFSIIGLQIQMEHGLSETQLGLLLATPILTGSVSRIFLGILCEKYGGRLLTTLMMLASAGSIWLLTYAETFPAILVAALGIGLAGGTFITGITFTSYWYPKNKQGTALGIFGMGNAGAGLTNFGAPLIMVAVGWQGTAMVYAIIMGVSAILFWLLTEDDPATRARRSGHATGATLKEQLEPLRYLQVWRFGLYYFFVFGAFVALASWLPRYYTGMYDMSIAAAGTLAASYSLSASVFRALGGWMADKWGARAIMYWTFGVSVVCLFILSYPATTYIVQGIHEPIEFHIGIGVVGFTIVAFFLGFVMSLGKAAVYKHIPVYYPNNVGSVGGMVGMIGGLGGFVLPIVFGVLNDWTGIWTTPFMFLFVMVACAMTWMHFAILRMERRKFPGLRRLRDLPEGVPPGQTMRSDHETETR